MTARAIAPLLIAVTEDQSFHDSYLDGSSRYWTRGRRRYYFWCFGFAAKLPYEHDTPSSSF